ncbi:MAG: 3-phosphoshikimate 1-carboxyvinyltransferase [Planctomycetota bacterium]|jgi:3-phosphoshikimate 1-carboxyvinyltransferase
MDMTAPFPITPLAHPVSGIWRVPGSKSITNRAYLLAALADEPCELSGVLHSDDTRHMANALRALGCAVEDLDHETVRVSPAPWRTPEQPLFIGNSGTSVRFLAAALPLVTGRVELTGDEHMAKRPIGPLLDALNALGVEVDCTSGCPPLTVTGNGSLNGGEVVVPGTLSSQYFSALAMAACRASTPLRIVPDGILVSRPYVAMTLAMIRSFAGQADWDGDAIVVEPRPLRCPHYTIEPDASAASYPLALAAASGTTITVPDLGGDSLQGDTAFAEVLAQMGATVERSAAGLSVSGPHRLRGIDVDMHHISDTVMSLAAIAPLADGPTTIRNVANIRIKETDRLLATVTELRRLGQQVDHGDDWLRITPQPITPATIHCYADHRMAMAFAILGLCTPGVTIEDPACVSKTYPAFWTDLATFRGSH